MKTLASNKKAFHEYQILEKIVCGIILVGSEVKSIKNGKASLAEAYCFISNGEIFIKGMNVTPHKEGGIHNNHEPLRDRKLLLKKKEIIKGHEQLHVTHWRTWLSERKTKLEENDEKDLD